MFKREKFKEFNLRYDENSVLIEDYRLWVDAIDKVKFAAVPSVLVKYRKHDSSVSALKPENQQIVDEGHFKIFKFFYNKLNVVPSEKELIMHRRMGILSPDLLTETSVEEYLELFKKIIEGNKQAGYFHPNSLNNVILSSVLYLSRQSYSSNSFKSIMSFAKNTFAVNDYVYFLKEKIPIKIKKAKSF
jgi:hypothetical protein